MVIPVVQIPSGNLGRSRSPHTFTDLLLHDKWTTDYVFFVFSHSNANVKVNITFGASLVSNCTQKDAVKRLNKQLTISRSLVPSKGRLRYASLLEVTWLLYWWWCPWSGRWRSCGCGERSVWGLFLNQAPSYSVRSLIRWIFPFSPVVWRWNVWRCLNAWVPGFSLSGCVNQVPLYDLHHNVPVVSFDQTVLIFSDGCCV